MKVNFERPIINALGEAGIDKLGAPQYISTLLLPIIYSYGGHVINGEQRSINPEKKLRAYSVLVKIQKDAKNVDLTLEEASLVKEIAAESLTAGTYGQVVDILEGNVD